ncbi:MAG: P1 family peptidase [Clostridiales bacterium]|jgi:L-aminopeptidase/D-esterase-like protein|nr:P1 family peptidase [Clostridiales bacterium]
MKEIDIAELSAFKIGNAQNKSAQTGVSVVICERGGVCGVDVRGGSPATREITKLGPIYNNKCAHGIVLAGGSSFGLAAADGVMRFLEARGVGRDTGIAKIPNVAAASLFDLKVGDGKVRPDADMGREACENAFAGGQVTSGKYGAGCGATVGKARDMAHSMAGGLGVAAFRQGNLAVGALAAVNCIGDIVKNGEIIAGTLGDDGTFADSEKIIVSQYANVKDFFSENTILAVIMTNADLDKAEMTRVAMQGQNGIALAIRPPHSIFDGDTCFAICSGEVRASQDAVGILAREAVKTAIYKSIFPSLHKLNIIP